MFSRRLPARLATNAVTDALSRLRAAGRPIVDLTETNPTVVGLPYPADVLQPLAGASGTVYRPEPFGLAGARDAVSADYARRGLDVPAARIVLTASTSEAYSLLFKLLCDPGDAVLVPQPSYPLFELLTQLEGVDAVPYRTEFHGRWSIDRAGVEAALTTRTRAILVVSPNNPTGSMLRAADRDWLLGLCARHNLALIGDEVFADYPIAPRPDAVPVLGEAAALVFSLGGLSKSAGLPQLKLGWIAVAGPERLSTDALRRLEIICDTYLSVSTPVQIAAPQLLASGGVIRELIRARLDVNLQAMRAALTSHPSIQLLEPEGGWSAVLRVPSIDTEDALVARVLDEAAVLVHPGYFFDFPEEAFLVVSLLPEPARFAQGLAEVLPRAAGRS